VKAVNRTPLSRNKITRDRNPQIHTCGQLGSRACGPLLTRSEPQGPSVTVGRGLGICPRPAAPLLLDFHRSELHWATNFYERNRQPRDRGGEPYLALQHTGRTDV
jgi:hypothetical protein